MVEAEIYQFTIDALFKMKQYCDLFNQTVQRDEYFSFNSPNAIDSSMIHPKKPSLFSDSECRIDRRRKLLAGVSLELVRMEKFNQQLGLNAVDQEKTKKMTKEMSLISFNAFKCELQREHRKRLARRKSLAVLKRYFNFAFRSLRIHKKWSDHRIAVINLLVIRRRFVKSLRRRHDDATKIQRFYRKYRSINYLHHRIYYRDKLLRFLLGFMSKKKITKSKAALKLQCWIRIIRARRRREAFKRERDERLAAVVIQHFFRKHHNFFKNLKNFSLLGQFEVVCRPSLENCVGYWIRFCFENPRGASCIDEREIIDTDSINNTVIIKRGMCKISIDYDSPDILTWMKLLNFVEPRKHDSIVKIQALCRGVLVRNHVCMQLRTVVSIESVTSIQSEAISLKSAARSSEIVRVNTTLDESNCSNDVVVLRNVRKPPIKNCLGFWIHYAAKMLEGYVVSFDLEENIVSICSNENDIYDINYDEPGLLWFKTYTEQEEKEAVRAAIKIQAVLRGRLGRKRAQKIAAQLCLREDSTLLFSAGKTSVFNCTININPHRQLTCDKDIYRSVVKIQAAIRGRYVRKSISLTNLKIPASLDQNPSVIKKEQDCCEKNQWKFRVCTCRPTLTNIQDYFVLIRGNECIDDIYYKITGIGNNGILTLQYVESIDGNVITLESEIEHLPYTSPKITYCELSTQPC